MTWALVERRADLDVQEDANGVTKVRKHIVITVRTMYDATLLMAADHLGDTQSSVTYQVGAITRTVNPGTGSFICVGDAEIPVQHPLEKVYRNQTWEYFGPWTAAPAGWNQ